MNGTLNGNPVAAAAGRATLRLLDAAAYDRLDHLGHALRTGIRQVFSDAGLPAQLLGVGAMYDLRLPENEELHDYRATQDVDAAMTRAIVTGVLERGIFVGSEKGYISLAHTDDDVAATLEAFQHVAEAVAGDRQAVA